MLSILLWRGLKAHPPDSKWCLGQATYTAREECCTLRGEAVLKTIPQEVRILREYVQRMHSFRNAASINPLAVVLVASQVWGMLGCTNLQERCMYKSVE